MPHCMCKKLKWVKEREVAKEEGSAVLRRARRQNKGRKRGKKGKRRREGGSEGKGREG